MRSGATTAMFPVATLNADSDQYRASCTRRRCRWREPLAPGSSIPLDVNVLRFAIAPFRRNG